MSASEFSNLQARCGALGCGVSSYIRDALAAYAISCDGCDGDAQGMVGVAPRVYGRFAYGVSKITNNLNQAKRAIDDCELMVSNLGLGMLETEIVQMLEMLGAARGALAVACDEFGLLHMSIEAAVTRAVARVPAPHDPECVGTSRAARRRLRAETMTASLRVRVGESEREAIRAECAALGCTVSSYIRHAIIAYAVACDKSQGARPTNVVVDARLLGAFAPRLDAPGAEANRVAHLLNTVSLIFETCEFGLSDMERAQTFDMVCDARDSLPPIGRDFASIRSDIDVVTQRPLVVLPGMYDTAPVLAGARGGERACR